MSQSKSLTQLLRLRELAEEQSRMTLEAALQYLAELNRIFNEAEQRVRAARACIYISPMRKEQKMERFQHLLPLSEQALERHAGVEELKQSEEMAEQLRLQIQEQQVRVEVLRTTYLHHRVEKRQAETLVKEEAMRHRLQQEKRQQQTLDDWFGSRLVRQKQLDKLANR